jgi:hypothetical protein
MLLCKLCYLRNFGFGDILGIDPAYRRTFIMYFEHDL